MIRLVLIMWLGAIWVVAKEPDTVEIFMPHEPQVLDGTVLCYSVKLFPKETYVTGFIAIADKKMIKEMVLYGCKEPGGQDSMLWNCGRRDMRGVTLSRARSCKRGSRIIYEWDKEVPRMTLPKDVAFEVGGKTKVRYLVLQVRYKKYSNDLKDIKDPGIVLITAKNKLPKRAGVYLMGAGGRVKAHTTGNLETACMYTENVEMHPFAYKVKTHRLGKVVSGYRIRNGNWTEIGRMNPHQNTPQAFYLVQNSLDVLTGDILAARCTINNDMTTTVRGVRKRNMCNFFIMYYVVGRKLMKDKYCFTRGPPKWRWDDFREGNMSLSNMPKTVSVVPGTVERLNPSVKARDAHLQKNVHV